MRILWKVRWIIIAALGVAALAISQEAQSPSQVLAFEEVLGSPFLCKITVPSDWKQDANVPPVVNGGSFSVRFTYIRGPGRDESAAADRSSTLRNFPPELRKEIEAGPLKGMLAISLQQVAGRKCAALVYLHGELDSIIALAEWKEIPTLVEVAGFEKALRTITIVAKDR